MASAGSSSSNSTVTSLKSDTLEDNEDVPIKKRKPSNWDFREYMQEKKRKLNEQFVSMSGEQESDIFKGVTIYVDGFTEPSDAELKKLIHLNGGSYSYKHTSDVTHVIATYLPDVKVKNMPKVVAVSSKWIVDSMKAGQLLATESYRLYSSHSRNQTHISFDHAASMSPGSSHDKQMLKSSDELVSEFYSHSRLHHLSTWTSELKQYVSTSISESSCAPSRVPESESLKSQGQSAIVHLDFDCFFASASTRNLPHLKGKPVVVTHAKWTDKSAMQNSMADIASCNYVARKAGVRNGMHIGKAIQMCPELVPVPYDFETYHRISLEFYDILLSHTHALEAVSCDEAFVSLANHATSLKEVVDLVESIRKEVKIKTGCDLSAGIGSNMLLARMATRKAKPNGQYLIQSEEVEAFMSAQKIEHLPGVGYRLCHKLNDKGIKTCSDLKSFPLSDLRELLGPKTSQMLYDYSRGVDERVVHVSAERKSLSAEMNFGIRPKSLADVESIIESMCAEVEKRALAAKVQGKLVTLKLKIRSKNASLSTKKYLGHGLCDNISRSLSLSHSTRSAAELFAACLKSLEIIKPSAQNVRGIGIQIGKLIGDEEEDSKKRKGLSRYLVSAGASQDLVQNVASDTCTPRQAMFSPSPKTVTAVRKTFVSVSPGHSKPTLLTTSNECSTSYTDMKGYLGHWIDTTSPLGPCEQDIATFAAYCIGILSTNMEGVYVLLQWLRVCLQSRGTASWKASFNKLLQLVNAEVSSVFGGVLKLELL